MDARTRLSFERLTVPAPGHPETTTAGKDQSRLNISVVFTSVETTLGALKTAGALANRLSGRITLVVPQVVPFPLPLDSPPVLIDWNERRFSVIASQSPVETEVRLYLCRDRLEMLANMLSPRSLVVVGARKRWWRFTAERKVARILRRMGHEVVLTETE